MITDALIAITLTQRAMTQSSINIGKIEARENLNHDEDMEGKYYYNVDSDESDIDAN